MRDQLLHLVNVRAGHFRLESGHHAETWMDLDQLFTRPAKLRPFVSALAGRLAPHGLEAVYGPLTGGAFLAYAIADHLRLDFGFVDRVPSGRRGLFPVDYRLAPALRAAATGRRVALVDDAISAGSAVRAALTDLTSCGAIPVALGALITIGPRAAALAAEQHLPLESLIELPAAIYTPAECPMCALGAPLSDP